MLEINMSSNLNPLDKSIHERIVSECKQHTPPTIVEAAKLCHCSPSKISKFVKKLGFNNYKQYIDYLCGRKQMSKTFSNEFERIKHFLDTFDLGIIERFVNEIKKYPKIALLGYGPSRYCAEYFRFKLQLFSKQSIFILEDEFSASNVIDDSTLVIVFSATGSFDAFQNFQMIAQENGAHFLLLMEEYNTSAIPSYGEIRFLTDTFQTISSVPYEKSRIIFFIFIEEVIAYIIRNRN